MDHYKSWSGLNKWLCECLCEELKDRITYFLTRYHKVHDSYGRAAILLDGKELVCFSWIEQYRQEQQVAAKQNLLQFPLSLCSLHPHRWRIRCWA